MANFYTVGNYYGTNGASGALAGGYGQPVDWTLTAADPGLVNLHLFQGGHGGNSNLNAQRGGAGLAVEDSGVTGFGAVYNEGSIIGGAGGAGVYLGYTPPH